MNIPGEKFTLPLDSDSDPEEAGSPPPPPLNAQLGFVRDIIEKPISSAPTAPILPPNATCTGFPAHKKRAGGPSKFRQRAQQDLEAQRRRQAAAPPPPPPPPPASASAPASSSSSQDELTRTERQRISDENDQRIAAMSAEEIDEERQELLKGLSPALIERLLKKSELDHGAVHGSFTGGDDNDETDATQSPHPHPQPETPNPASSSPPPTSKKVHFDPTPPPDTLPPATHVHFPPPPTSPTDDLDPSDPNFFTHLHTKYFPTLPADPSKLAWMRAPSASQDLSYHPSQPSLPVSALRFDFRGDLLPPRTSRELPSNLGLHHHADAPNAAGYTVPELARLARSAFPTQRCMAMQMLGRILYKLGKGLYGVEEITQGLWRCMDEGRVIAGLEEAAAGRMGGHLSVKAYATDALWLWQKGGGHRWKAE